MSLWGRGRGRGLDLDLGLCLCHELRRASGRASDPDLCHDLDPDPFRDPGLDHQTRTPDRSTDTHKSSFCQTKVTAHHCTMARAPMHGA